MGFATLSLRRELAHRASGGIEVALYWSPEIKSLAVQGGLRRRGLGTQLVTYALEWCRPEGARAATVTTTAADLDNVCSYLRNGFRASAIERDAFTPEAGYPADGSNDTIPVLDAIRFDYPLASAPSLRRADR